MSRDVVRLLRRLIGLMTGLLSILMGVQAQENQPCPAYVQAGESLQTILDAAPEGTVVCLSAGVWRENLILSKSLTLRGAGTDKTVIEGAAQGRPVLQVGGDVATCVVIENLTVRYAIGRPTDCVSVYPASSITICPDGIALHGECKVVLKNRHVTNNGRMGIYANDSVRVTMSDCLVSGSGRIGIFVRRSAIAEVVRAVITENNEGANISDSAQAPFKDTRPQKNTSYGVLVAGQSACWFDNCMIADNGQHGLALWGGAKSRAFLMFDNAKQRIGHCEAKPLLWYLKYRCGHATYWKRETEDRISVAL